MAWADKWQMNLNTDKCKIIHFGRNNPQYQYTLGTTQLNSTQSEKDVGVYIQNNLKPSLQCEKAAKKANSVLGQMYRAVTYRDKNVWIKLYKTFVRPHLEYCVQAWSPWTVHDIQLLEKVQERAVKMVTGLKSRTYQERLSEIGLLSLEDRRTRGDIIMVWKIMNRKVDVLPSTYFERFDENAKQTRIASDPMNIRKPQFNLEIRKNFFSIRVIDKWNSLPDSIKKATSLNQFKNLYDE